MAKLVLNDIASLANTSTAKAALNDNFAAIEAAFDSTLSRDGSVPNHMEADIDVNGNDVLNVNKLDVRLLYKNGVPFEQTVAYGDKRFELFDGTGVQVSFPLSQDPGSLGNLEVSVDGEMLRPGLDYNYVGTTLTFVAAPASGTDNILVRYDTALPTGVTSAASVLFQQQGVGSVLRPSQDKQRELLSVLDFGAVGDGATNDLSAILATDTEGPFTFTRGTYRVASNLTIANDIEFMPGAVVYVDAGVTLTLSGSVVAGPTKIFDGPGTVNGFAKNWTLLPEWFGAVPNGVTDSTTALQKTITAAVGREVELSGMYRCSSTITISAPVLLRGKSKTNSGIITSNLTADVLDIACGASPLTGVEVRDLTLDATSAKSAGFGIKISATTGGTLYYGVFKNIFMSDRMFGGMRVQSAFFLRLEEIEVAKVGQNSVGFHFAGVDAVSKIVEVTMRRCMVRTGVSGTLTIGLLIDSYSEGFYISDSSSESAGLNYGVYIANGAGAPRPPENLFFTRYICDNTTGTGWNIVACLTTRLTDCWAATCTVDGFRISAGVDVELKGFSAIANGQYGAAIAGGTEVRILGGIFDGNGQAASNTYAGVVVAGGVSAFTIKDADFNRTGTTKTHRHDIQVIAGASNHYIIKNNRCRGYLTSAVSDGGAGANKVVNENLT